MALSPVNAQDLQGPDPVVNLEFDRSGSMEFDVEDGLVGNSDAGLIPGNPFYFLDSWAEGLSLFFTFNNEKKAEKRLRFAEEKIAEAEELAGDAGLDPEKLQKRLDKAMSKYEEHMNRLDKRLDKMPDDVRARVGEIVANRTDLHIDVLDRVMDIVPEQAKQRIFNASNSSKMGQQRALLHFAKVYPEEAAELTMDLAEKHLLRGQQKVKDDPDFANREFDRFKEHMEAAQRVIGEICCNLPEKEWSDFERGMVERLQNNADVLQRVSEQVPENARERIDENIKRSLEHNRAMFEHMYEVRESIVPSRRGIRPLLRDGLSAGGPGASIIADGPSANLRDGIMFDGPETVLPLGGVEPTQRLLAPRRGDAIYDAPMN